MPASDDPKDIEIADFVTKNFDQLHNPSFKECLDNLLDSMAYGFKIGEIIWNFIDGKYSWKTIKFQHPILFDFEYDIKNNLEFVLYGYHYGHEEKIPVKLFTDKFITMVYPYLKDGNWYGDSEFRELYFEWWSKYNIKRWRNEFIQGRGKPVPHVTYDSAKTSSSEKDELKDIFENWQDNMFILIPGYSDPETGELRGKFKIDWVVVGEKENVDIHTGTINEIDKAITRKVLLPDRLGYTEDQTGSFAQSQKIFDLIIMGIEKIHHRLEDVVNPKIKQLVDLNFANVKDYPKWGF